MKPLGPYGRAIALGILGLVFVGAWMVHAYRQGADNLTLCGTLQPGGQRAELVRALGAPTGSTVNPAKTRLALRFASPLFAEKPIRAVVNVRDDVVVEIDCGNGRVVTSDKY